MTTKRFRPLAMIALALYLGTHFDLSGASSEPPAEEDRIGELEQEVAALRSELTKLRKIVANDKMWDRIRGPWRQQSHLHGGNPVLGGSFGANVGEVVWRLYPEEADQRNFLAEPDIWILGSMTLDATKDPVWVDFNKYWGGVVRVIPGILKVETERDRRMQVPRSIGRVERKRVHIALRRDASCTPNDAGVYDERPASFESTEDNGVSVFVLEPYR